MQNHKTFEKLTSKLPLQITHLILIEVHQKISFYSSIFQSQYLFQLIHSDLICQLTSYLQKSLIDFIKLFIAYFWDVSRIHMLKLPKIDEDALPIKNQYRQVVMSKITQKDKNSKFDWIRCQINFAQKISHELILREMIQFQTKCKQRQIPLFYSYFFLKSLFLNKPLKALVIQKPKSSQQKDRKNLTQVSTLFDQLQKYIIETLKEQRQKIQEEKSFYHRIQNYVNLRQDLLNQTEELSKKQSHNFIHQHADDIRFLNLEIVDLIKLWKEEHFSIQAKNFPDQKSQVEPFQSLQPIYFYQDQNYINKMVYDNGGIINTANQRKISNFIGPPNPFFLSQDGNKESMSLKLKQNIEFAMEYFAQQKAYQLKLLLQQPQYVAKGRSLKDKIGNSRMNTQKTDDAKSQSIKKSGSLNKLQISKKSNNRELINPKLTNLRGRYASLNNKKPDVQIMAAYQTQALRLRQQVQRKTDNLEKFQKMVKKSELQIIKQIQKKKNPSQQQQSNLKQKKNLDNKVFQSPYLQKISSLRKQIQKNISSIKGQKIQNLVSSHAPSTDRAQILKNSTQISSAKPKLKLITERQINYEKLNKQKPNFFTKKTMVQEDQSNIEQKDEKKQKLRRKSFSNGFKNQQVQEKTIIKRRNSVSKFRLAPVTPSENSKDLKKENSSQNINQNKYQENKIQPQNKTGNLENKNSKSSGYFLYKPKQISNQLQNYLNLKRNCNTPEIGNYNSSENNVQNQRAIQIEIRNLKQRLRDMEIMKIYGQKVSIPTKKQQLQNNFISMKQETNNQQKVKPMDRSLVKSKEINTKNHESKFQKKPSTSLEKKTTDQLKSSLTMIDKETANLQQRIQKLIKLKEQTKPVQKMNMSIQQDQSKRIQDIKNLHQTSNLQNKSEELQQKKQSLDQNLLKLQKKQHLIEQSNQIKKKQIQKNKKTKQKITTQIQEKSKKLSQLEQRINEMKNQRKKIAQTQQKLSHSILSKKLQQISEEKQSIISLKIKQSDMQKQNQILKEQMKTEEEKFIQLKENQYKLREQASKKKYLQSIEQMKTQYLQKQKQYEQKILEEQRQRKENQIQLIKEKREAQELKMKLLQQSMKQILLKEILETEKQRQSKLQRQAEEYELQVRKKIQMEIRQKEQYQRKMAENFKQQNERIQRTINQIKEKNKKLQEINKKKMEQVQQMIQQKQIQVKKLYDLEKQTGKVQQILDSGQKVQENKLEKVIKQVKENNLEIENNISQEITHQKEKQQKPIVQVPDLSRTPLTEQQEIQIIKLRVKQEILQEMIQRRKKDQEEEMKFQQERKKRLKILQFQIKQFLKKQTQINQKIQQEQFGQVDQQIQELKEDSLSRVVQNDQQAKQNITLQKSQQKVVASKEQNSLSNSTLSFNQLFNLSVNVNVEKQVKQVKQVKQQKKQVRQQQKEQKKEKQNQIKEIKTTQKIVQKPQKIQKTQKQGQNKLEFSSLTVNQMQNVINEQKKLQIKQSQIIQEPSKVKLNQKQLTNQQQIQSKQSKKSEQKTPDNQKTPKQQNPLKQVIKNPINQLNSTQNLKEKPIKQISLQTQPYIINQEKQLKKDQNLLKQITINSEKVKQQQLIKNQQTNQKPQPQIEKVKNFPVIKNQQQKPQNQPVLKQVKKPQIVRNQEKREQNLNSITQKKNVQLPKNQIKKEQNNIFTHQIKDSKTLNVPKDIVKQEPSKPLNDQKEIKIQKEELKQKNKQQNQSLKQQNIVKQQKHVKSSQVKSYSQKKQNKQAKPQNQKLQQNKTQKQLPLKQKTDSANNNKKNLVEKQEQDIIKADINKKTQQKSQNEQLKLTSQLSNLQQKVIEKAQQIKPIIGKQEPKAQQAQKKQIIEKQKPQILQAQKKQTIEKQKLKTQISKENENDKREEEIEKTSKSQIKRSNQQVFQKYQALQPFLNMKSKFLLIQQHQIKSFIAKFYSSYPEEVNQMLPYSQKQLQIILRKHRSLKKKIDIFDCFSIGWYEVQKNKYHLIGSIQCIHLIIEKYGEVQIQLAFVFDKSDLKQKQYLAKQLKFYSKVGYVYQKRMKQESLFSVKVIIKIPKQIVPKGFQIPDELIKFKTIVSLNSPFFSQKINSLTPEVKHNNVFWHLLGDCLISQLTNQDLTKYISSCQSQSVDVSFFTDSLRKQEVFEHVSPYITSEQENTSEFEISFDLPYVQLGNQTFLSLQSKQYSLGTANHKFYLAYNSNENNESNFTWKLLVFEAEKSIISQNYLQTYLTTKINQINSAKPEKEVRLMVPAFSVKSSLRMTEDDDFKKSFIHRSSISCDLLPSSISVSDSLPTENRKIIELSEEHGDQGFVFCICSCMDNKIEKVMAGSWVGFKEQIIHDQFSSEFQF